MLPELVDVVDAFGLFSVVIEMNRQRAAPRRAGTSTVSEAPCCIIVWGIVTRNRDKNHKIRAQKGVRVWAPWHLALAPLVILS